MIFGKKEIFAIEAYLNQGDRYVFANYCFWIKGNKIGDLTQYTLIDSIIDLINIVFLYKGKRHEEHLDKAEYTDIIEKYISKYIEDSNGFVFNIASYHDECVQGYYIFLIERNGYDIIFVKDNIDNTYIYYQIPKNSIYRCFKKLDDWIKESTVLVLKDYIYNLEGISKK